MVYAGVKLRDPAPGLPSFVYGGAEGALSLVHQSYLPVGPVPGAGHPPAVQVVFPFKAVRRRPLFADSPLYGRNASGRDPLVGVDDKHPPVSTLLYGAVLLRPVALPPPDKYA